MGVRGSRYLNSDAVTYEINDQREQIWQAQDSSIMKQDTEYHDIELIESMTFNTPPPLHFTYVQGMNVLAAPFLYAMPSEVEAFYAFARFIEWSCPLYVQPTLEGVHRGLRVSLGHLLRMRMFNVDFLIAMCYLRLMYSC